MLVLLHVLAQAGGTKKVAADCRGMETQAQALTAFTTLVVATASHNKSLCLGTDWCHGCRTYWQQCEAQLPTWQEALEQ